MKIFIKSFDVERGQEPSSPKNTWVSSTDYKLDAPRHDVPWLPTDTVVLVPLRRAATAAGGEEGEGGAGRCHDDRQLREEQMVFDGGKHVDPVHQRLSLLLRDLLRPPQVVPGLQPVDPQHGCALQGHWRQRWHSFGIPLLFIPLRGRTGAGAGRRGRPGFLRVLPHMVGRHGDHSPPAGAPHVLLHVYCLECQHLPQHRRRRHRRPEFPGEQGHRRRHHERFPGSERRHTDPVVPDVLRGETELLPADPRRPAHAPHPPAHELRASSPPERRKEHLPRRRQASAEWLLGDIPHGCRLSDGRHYLGERSAPEVVHAHGDIRRAAGAAGLPHEDRDQGQPRRAVDGPPREDPTDGSRRRGESQGEERRGGSTCPVRQIARWAYPSEQRRRRRRRWAKGRRGLHSPAGHDYNQLLAHVPGHGVWDGVRAVHGEQHRSDRPLARLHEQGGQHPGLPLEHMELPRPLRRRLRLRLLPPLQRLRPAAVHRRHLGGHVRGPCGHLLRHAGGPVHRLRVRGPVLRLPVVAGAHYNVGDFRAEAHGHHLQHDLRCQPHRLLRPLRQRGGIPLRRQGGAAAGAEGLQWPPLLHGVLPHNGGGQSPWLPTRAAAVL